MSTNGTQANIWSILEKTLIDFLNKLRAHLGRDAKVTLLWDGLPSRRSRDMPTSPPTAEAGCAWNASPPTPPN